AVAFAAHVRGVDAAEGRRRFRQRDQFGRGTEGGGRILQGRRNTERTIAHRARDDRLHLLQLVRRWLAVAVTDHHFARSGGADVGTEVHRDALFLQAREVFTERA